jgi:signal transduction histidine kinase
MKLNNPQSLRWYFRIFNVVARTRLKANDVDVREIHTLTAAVIPTAFLMWAYAFLALFTIPSRIPGVIGILCASIHILSPLLFRFTNHTYFIMNIMLGSGLVHQGTFAYYTGGFNSNILIWYGILPMIGGVICSRKGAVTWLYTTCMVSIVFFALHLSGHQYPHQISSAGKLISQGLLVFGWIFLSSIIVIVYSSIHEYSEKKLKEQGKKIDDLFRVLFHDLANPLGRIAIGLSIAKKQLQEGEQSRGLEIAKQASDSMLEITQNIRKMYAVSKGKANVDLALMPLNTSVKYISDLYATELEKKQIKISYHFEKNEGIHLLVEPVSFNNLVLGNIITHAIKFSPIGGDIHLTAYPHSQGSIMVEVRDHGIGIPSSLLCHLFDLNKKTSRPGTIGESGTGFGLHIMKSFIEMYGGNLFIESMDAKENTHSGTTVKILLKGECN